MKRNMIFLMYVLMSCSGAVFGAAPASASAAAASSTTRLTTKEKNALEKLTSILKEIRVESIATQAYINEKRVFIDNQSTCPRPQRVLAASKAQALHTLAVIQRAALSNEAFSETCFMLYCAADTFSDCDDKKKKELIEAIESERIRVTTQIQETLKRVLERALQETPEETLERARQGALTDRNFDILDRSAQECDAVNAKLKQDYHVLMQTIDTKLCAFRSETGQEA